MSLILRLFAAIVLILSCEVLPAAKPRVDPDCRDDRGTDRCSAEQQKRVRELFGVRSIEEHAAAGDQVRRAFYVDGYGRDVIAIAFVRSPGRDPMLWVHFPREEKVRSEPLTAPVPESVWSGVIARSAHFDRRIVPLREPASDGEISLCIHSWVYTIEAVDPPEEKGSPPTVRRRTEDACENGLGEAYASELTRAAVPLLPHCSRLERAQHRNEASLLNACRLLGGDRLAAAEVMNRIDPFDNVEDAEDARTISHLFDYDSVVDWNGQRNQGAGSGPAFWAKQVSEGDGRTILYYDRFVGENADRVTFTGLLSRSVTGNGYETARVQQVWKRDGDDFVIEHISVGPFERLADP